MPAAACPERSRRAGMTGNGTACRFRHSRVSGNPEQKDRDRDRPAPFLPSGVDLLAGGRMLRRQNVKQTQRSPHRQTAVVSVPV
jgi:hypothetical protein